jgi:hypothetical protein
MSDDVIGDEFISTPDSRIWDFSPRGFPPKKSGLFPDGSDRRFKFHKRSQLLFRTHNEPLAVAAMCISNEDRSRLGNPDASRTRID